MSALTQLPKIVKTAILGEVAPDPKSSKNIQEVQRLYRAISYEGNLYPVRLTVKVLREKRNNVYSYEVIDIESPSLHPGNPQAGTLESSLPEKVGNSLLPESSTSSPQRCE
jgi:hypothetical protein